MIRRHCSLRILFALLGALCVLTMGASSTSAQPARFLGREEIILYGIGLRVEPATQTVPKDFATIVSTFLQAPTLPGDVSPFAPDAEMRATLRGPSFAQPIELTARPNSPFNIPVLTVPGTHVLENIRMVSGGEVVMYATPESARIDVIERLLVTTVTARPLTADEIREKGIVFDKDNFQAYNFTAAFAVDDGSKIDITFPVVLPTIVPPGDVNVSTVDLQGVTGPLLKGLKTIIPDTLQIQSRIPNLSVVGFTLTLDDQPSGQNFVVPPIPGVIVIPGDIGFLNQFFSVMLMVANVAPEGSNLVVSELTANIVLPPGVDNVVGSQDDPLRMANLATGESARLVHVTQAGADGQLGTGDDITTLGPAQTGNAEFLVEGRREGTHVVEMELAGTLNGLPIGPVPIRGRAAGAVLVRNPKFTLTFTHPDIVNAGEPYTLDVTVTNTTESPANFVSLNLFAQNISGARLDDETTKGIDSIAPGDSASVSFRLISNLTGTITAATLDSDENVAGRFALKTSVGELGVPLSPDSLILPKEASGLPKALRDAALGLLGRAWAVATAPPAALPKDLSRFSKQLVIDRAVETAEAGFRVQLGEPLPRTVHTLLFDFLGSDYTELAARVPANDTTGLLGLLQRDFKGFDLLRRRSVRGDVLTSTMAKILGPSFAAGAGAFHRDFAEQATSRPAHVSVLVSGASGGTLDFDASLVDAGGLRLGPTENGKIVSEIPFGDVMTFTNEQGLTTGRLFVIAVPEAGNYSLVLTPLANAPPGATVDISVVVPGADGALRVTSIDDLGAADGFTVSNGATDPLARYAVSRSATGGSTLTPTLSSVNDPLPTVLGVVQMSSADVVGCNPEEDPGKQFNAGRVVAVLFSEEVTPASVQDKLAAGEIVSFRPEANRAVSVALQPGRRIAFVALRKPFGPLVPRTMTIEGAVDRAGQAMAAAVTLPVQMSNLGDAATVAGRVLNADGTPAAGISLRMFYEIQCASGPVVVGIGEDTAGPDGAYAFDHVVVAPSVTTKLVAVNEDAGELKVVRFRPARVGQRLNVDVVFIGRGAITGITYAEDGRTPLAGTAIRVTSLTDQSQYGTTTDAAGRYTVTRVPVGSLLLEAVNVARPATLFVSDVIPFAGAVVTRDLSLLDVDTTGTTISTGVITGRVLRADGVTGIEGVPVIAYYAHNSQAGVGCPSPGYGPPPSECAVAVVQSAADGAFSFPAVTSGSLRIYSFDQTGLEEGSVRVTLLPSQTFDLNLLLSGGVGTVRGTVLDSNGAPVTDAVVGGGLSLVNVNPADGTFVLTDVPVGQRTLVAVSEALRARGETTIDIVQAGEQINATIVLEPSASISGLVRDANGVAQSGIKVWVFVDCYDKQEQPSICVEGEATTDASGGYRIDGLKLGTYRVSAFRADLKDGNIAQVALRYNAQVLKTDITFRGALGRVTGRVLRACSAPPCADTPLPARVAISGERLVVAGGQIATEFRYIQNFEVVDNDFTTGAFEFDGIWAGNFTVKAAGQFSPEPVSAAGTMTAGQTVNLDLRLMPTSRITGTVFEPDGFTPVTNRQVALEFKSNAVVVICTEDSSTGDSDCQTIPQGIQSASAATDAQGRFSFPVVNAGPFTIVATDTAQGRTARVEGTVRAGETVDLTARLLGRSRIVVNVRSNNGITPIAGARVDVAQVDYPKATRTGLTNASGQVVFEGGDALSEGLFVVTATDGGGFVGRVSNTVTTDGATVTANVFLFDATGTVTGQVVREDSTTALVPVPNAEVLVSTASGPIAYTVTDAQGQFEVTLVPTGAITVEAFDPVTAGRGRLSATVLNGQPTTFSVRLDALGVIRGTLLQSGVLTPLKGWTVTLSQTTPSGRSLPRQLAQTGVDGTFTFPGASVGSFSLRGTHRDVVATATAAGSLTRGGQLVDVPMIANIVRRVTGTITGVVTGPTGIPIANAQVDVCATGESCRPTTAGADGRFAQADIPLGRFTVRASAQVSGAPSVGTTGGTLLFEGDNADVTVTLLGLSTIEGTVYELVGSTRVPAANATVSLSGQPGSGCQGSCTQGTAPDGTFRFINVPARTFTITATGLNGQRGSIGDTLNSGETKSGLEVLLAPTVSMTGRVLLGTGEPAQGIVAEFSRGNAKLFAETGADGRFVFDAVSAGTYVLRLEDPVGIGLARRAGTIAVSGPIDLGDITLDDAAPLVTTSSPESNETGVTRTPEIRITFSEPVVTSTVNDDTITFIGPAGPVTGLVDLIDNDTVARFRLLPGVVLADKTAYSIRVSGVQDLVGRAMTADFTATFTTVDVTPPTITETTPTVDASGATIYTTVRVRFSEILDVSRFAGPAIVVRDPNGVALDGRIDYLFGNTTVVFTPARPLDEDTRYTVRIARATDLTGLVQASDTEFAFSTTDRTPPVVTALVPAGDGTVIENAITSIAATTAPADVAFVDFYINDAFAFTDRLGPFAMSLQAAPSFGAPGAQIKVSALATDTSGNRSTTPAVAYVTVRPDQAPTVAIVTPGAAIEAQPGQRIEVRVDASDDLGITQIAYSARGAIVIDAATRTLAAPAGTRTEAFAFNVPITALPGSAITIDASALDTKGQARQATPVIVRVLDGIGPTVEITGVTSGERVQPGQTVTAIVSASDPGGLAAIGFVSSGVVVSSTERAITPAQNAIATSFTFTVPANATSTDRVFLDAFARDVAGNRTDAARLILPVADRVAPSVTLRTQLGTLDMVPGQPVGVIVDASDDIGVARVVISGSGSFTFSDAKSFSSALADASASFSINVPATLVAGDTVVVTARSIDASGNQSTPTSITLTARTATEVTTPPSLTLLAGDTATLAVTLGAPAPAAGLRVDLASSSPSVATVTGILVFAQGETTKNATVNAIRGGTAQINASIDGTTRATTTVTVRGGVIRGTVITAAGSPGTFDPVANAQVTIFHGGTALTATTDAAGEFLVEGVQGTGFAVRATDGTLIGYTEGTLDVAGGSASITTILLPAGTLHGTVFAANGTTPAGADVKVDLYESSAPNVIVATTFTAADGTWQFPLVAITDYILVASDTSGNQGRTNASVTQSGLDVNVPITFLGRGSVNVTVLNGAGTPVPNAAVELRASSILGGAPMRTGSTNASGVVSFANVFVGSFSITARDPQTNQAGSFSGLITADQQAVPAQVTLSSYGNVRGTVFRANGTTRAAGATVTFRCVSGCGNTNVTADANGDYEFTFMPFTSFTVRASDAGSRAIGITTGAFTTSGETLVRNIVFEPQGTLLVTVNDADDQPVNGASVTAEVTGNGLTDTLSGVTGEVNGTPGQLVLDRLLAGPATVSASAAGLSGSATTAVVADVVTPVVIKLEPRAAITATVFDQDGQTPAAGTVALLNTGGGTLATQALVGGAATFGDRRFGTYALRVTDASGRVRATVNGIVLDVNGEVETRTLTFVALGTVRGRVLHPTDVGNLTVTLRSFHAEFGGTFSDRTDAAGNYEIGGVPLGLVKVSTAKPAESLIGETTGTLSSYLQPLTLDILLENNAVTLPTALSDANATSYTVAQGGGFGNGTGGVFSRGAFNLDITRDGSTTRFAGPAFGTREDGSREIATRDTVHGLNVTRKVFVPATGYFARFIESFSNPTADPITIDVTVASKLYGGRDSFCCVYGERDHFVGTTSSGDNVLGTNDRWAALGGAGINPYTNGFDGASLGIVFDGEGASQAIDAVSFTPAAPDNPFSYGWNSITIPAGGTVSLMHFVSAQGGYQGALASAQRLAQLPPEALEAMEPDEALTIANFAVPADGISIVTPLPSITGTVTGRVFEGNATTPVAGSTVTFQSSVGVHPRRLTVGTNANGEFSLSGGIGAPIPVAPFTLQALYPHGGLNYYTDTYTVSFPEGGSATTQDLVFTNFGILTGSVRRHTGVLVSGARVTGPYGFAATTDAAGRYRMGGVPVGSYTMGGTLSHPQGSDLTIVPAAIVLAPGEVRDDALVVEPTGTVTGVVKNAAGAIQVGRPVTLRDAANTFTRSTSTDSSGRFTLTDVRLGAFTLTSNDPVSGFPATTPVTVLQDATSDVEVRYLGSGTITVTVTRANGTLAQGIDVSVSGSGFSRPTQRTTATGVLTFTDIPLGQAASIVARHPSNTQITTTATVTLTPESGGTAQQALSMPGYGTIAVEIRRPNGTLAGSGVPVSMFGQAPSFSANTDINSQVTFGPVLLNQTFTLRVQHPTVRINFTAPRLDTVQTALTTDAEVKAITSRYPAVARVVVTATLPNGTPVVGAKVETSDTLFTGFQNRGVTNASGVVEVAQVQEGTFSARVYDPASPTTVIEVASGQVVAANDGGTVNLPVTYRNFTVSVRARIFQADGVTPLALPFAVELLRGVDRVLLARGCAISTSCFFGAIQGTNGEVVFPNVTSTGAGLIVRTVAPVGGASVGIYEATVVPTADGEVVVPVTQPFFRATLRGRVVASDGTTPIPGATLFTRTLANASYGSFGVNTGADGTFQFQQGFLPFIPSAGLLLETQVPGLPSFTTPTGPVTTLDQVIDTTVTLPDSVFTRVRGRVVAGDGVTPVAGSAVDVVYPAGSRQVTTTTDGRFELQLALAPPSTFTVRAHNPRHHDEVVESEHTATTQGGVVEVGDLVLPISVLSGRVTYGASTPAPNPNVFAYDELTDTTFFPDRNDEQGYYTFYDLPPATYRLTANDDFGQETTTAATLTTETSVVTNADLQFAELATLVIQVNDRNGNEAAYANAVVKVGQNFERWVGWFNDGQSGGTFELSVPLGTASAEAEVLTCADPDWYDTCASERVTGSVVVDQANARFDLLLYLEDNGAIGYNNVFLVPEGGGAGQNVTGPIEVSFLGTGGSLQAPQRTEVIPRANGEWLHTALPAGPLRIVMRVGNHMSIHDLDGPEPFSGYGVGPFPLYPAQRVLFQVFRDDESFYADTSVLVVIRSEGTERRLTTTTDADGNVVIEGLHPVVNTEVVFYMLDGSQTAFYVTVTPSGEATQYVEVRNFGV